jgi:hypothetical protein
MSIEIEAVVHVALFVTSAEETALFDFVSYAQIQ